MIAVRDWNQLGNQGCVFRPMYTQNKTKRNKPLRPMLCGSLWCGRIPEFIGSSPWNGRHEAAARASVQTMQNIAERVYETTPESESGALLHRSHVWFWLV